MTDTRSSAHQPIFRILFFALISVALLASACGGSDDDETSGGLFDTENPTATDDGNDDGNDDASGSDNGAADDAEEVVVEETEATEDSEESFAGAVDDSVGGEAAAPEAEADQSTSSEGALFFDAEGDAASSGAAESRAANDSVALGQGLETDAEGLFAPPPTSPDDEDYIEPPPNARLDDNRFTYYGYRQFIDADGDALSTFALDVDTGSYTVARRWLEEGVLPPPEAVRVEEFINAFDYDYDTPRRGLEVSVDGGPSPFDDDNILVRVGVQAEQVPDGERPPVALTFIVDTSGSMDRDNRLGLVKDSLEILVDELNDDDTVSIVVYSSSSGVVLEPTSVRNSRRIYDAIDSLSPGGSTNLESGLREGYALAAEAFRSDGINRVIIASDGVANAGITDQNQLGEFIRRYADEGIHLVTVGYGMGNYNDTMMEQLADNGDGFYAYVDSLDEAERLFEDELTSTLVTAAIDAKIQVEFDADVVDEYRLIGFENRGVRDSDFRNDAVDAGELGAGHQVTAMYEIKLHRGVDLDDRGDIGEVFLRWQDPDTGEVVEIDEDIDLRDVEVRFNDTAHDFQLATIVTSFGEVLRDNPYADDISLENIWVEADRVADRLDTDEVDELVDLVEIASRLY